MNELVFRALYNFVHGRAGLEMTTIFSGVYLGWIILTLVLIIFLQRARTRREAAAELIFSISTASVAWLVAHLIKWFWPVARPAAALGDITPLFTPGGVGAFPSGHAVFFFALALAVFIVDRRFGQWLIAAAVVISAARIAAGVHWPLDILGGLALAIFVTAIASFIIRLINPGFGRRLDG